MPVPRLFMCVLCIPVAAPGIARPAVLRNQELAAYPFTTQFWYQIYVFSFLSLMNRQFGYPMRIAVLSERSESKDLSLATAQSRYQIYVFSFLSLMNRLFATPLFSHRYKPAGYPPPLHTMKSDSVGVLLLAHHLRRVEFGETSGQTGGSQSKAEGSLSLFFIARVILVSR